MPKPRLLPSSPQSELDPASHPVVSKSRLSTLGSERVGKHLQAGCGVVADRWTITKMPTQVTYLVNFSHLESLLLLIFLWQIDILGELG